MNRACVVRTVCAFLMCSPRNDTFTDLGQHGMCSAFPGCDFLSKKLHEFVFFIERTADPGTWLGSWPSCVDSMGDG